MLFEGRFASPLFYESDIPELAKAAAKPSPPSSEHSILANSLTWAFVAAHHAEYRGSNKPPLLELRDGFAAAAAAGRQFLLTLGIGLEPNKLASESYSGVLNQSAVLREMIRRAPSDAILHEEVVDGTVSQYKMKGGERRRLAANKQIVESARAVAYVIVLAEDACSALSKPGRRPRGPAKAQFKPVLFSELVRCYHDMFNCWPTIERYKNGERPATSAAMKWLREVLRLASERLSESGYEAKASGNPLGNDLSLGEFLRGPIENGFETLASDFEREMTRRRPKKGAR
jgi:hypothetical protein